MKTIKLQVRAGKPFDDLKLFFKSIPEIFDHFKFDTSGSPDFVIYYSKHKAPKEKCVKILYAREYMNIDMRTCDWALGWQYEDQIKSNRYIRFPNYSFHHGCGKNMIKRKSHNSVQTLKEKTKFCSFIYWHKVSTRVDFFRRLGKYKFVHSPGPLCNNCAPIGGYGTPMQSRLSTDKWKEKIDYLRQYKFNIAFENRNAVGYTSEKLYHAFAANTIPIYWGNKLVGRDFNIDRFVHALDCSSNNERDIFNHLVRKVKELDNDDEKYINMLNQPCYPNNKLTPYADHKRLLNFFIRIFNSR